MTPLHQSGRNLHFTSLATLLIIFFISVIAYLNYQQRFSEDSQPTPDMPSIANDNLAEINNISTFFYTKIFLERDRTFLSIPFNFERGEIEYPVWVFLRTQPGTPTIRRLAYHPQLHKLQWSALVIDDASLFQKQEEYGSFEEFLASPPLNALIYVDPQLRIDPRYKHIISQDLTDDTDVEKADYVLTTFKPLRSDDRNNQYYETFIDATNAFVNEKNELVWQLRGSGVSLENPFYIGQINVGYRQE